MVNKANYQYPILFDEDSLQAIMDGVMTQFRRPAMGIPGRAKQVECGWYNKESFEKARSTHKDAAYGAVNYGKWGVESEYAVGNQLWLKEAIMGDNFAYAIDGRGYSMASGMLPKQFIPAHEMPEAYARTRIRIESVRVERIQDMSPQDMLDEGLWYRVPEYRAALHGMGAAWNEVTPLAAKFYPLLWDSHARDSAWETNPRTFVYRFTKVEK